jgi:ABC-type sugar transport system ATPase subunit
MLLELRAIQKHFGGVSALRRGDLSVSPGEVHLLLGENGAGKSTLMRIAAGILAPDGGEFLWRGRPAQFSSPADATAEGIAMVHQEPLLAPHLSVAENIFLGREPVWVKRSKVLRDAALLIEELQFPLQAEWLAGRLSPAGKQMVEICRAARAEARLLIFDEPTSSLSNAETEALFRTVRRFRERGAGIIYITHRMEELRAVGDRVTILRDGETVHSGSLAELTMADMIGHMVGRQPLAAERRAPGVISRDREGAVVELLRVDRLCRRNAFTEISFRLHAGEIVGIGGLAGAGRTELCEALFGLTPADSGEIRVSGQRVNIRSPRDAIRAGLALIPEDRGQHGLATALSLRDNLTLPTLGKVSRFGFISSSAEQGVVADSISRLGIRTSSGQQLACRLSGGNQQKAVIAKWLLGGAKIFLFDEPTRGIDIGAKWEVFEILNQLAREGAAILMVSSELTELLEMADRILVMREGRISAELDVPTTQDEILPQATPQGGAI